MATYDMSPLDTMDQIMVGLQVSNSIGIQTGNLKLHKDATLAELREEIYSKFEIPIEKQSIEIDGVNFNEADKNTILADIGLNEKSMIRLGRLDGEEVILDPSMSELKPAANIQQTQKAGTGVGVGVGVDIGGGGGAVVSAISSSGGNQGINVNYEDDIHAQALALEYAEAEQHNQHVHGANVLPMEIGYPEYPESIHQHQHQHHHHQNQPQTPPPASVKMDVVAVLQRWSMLQCRCVLFFMLWCVLFFGVQWGYLDMVYYLFAFSFAVIGWAGCRRLSVHIILLFATCLVLYVIILFLSQTNLTGRSSGAILFFRVVEILAICLWILSLWRFSWIVYIEKAKSPLTVSYASEKCRTTRVCV